MTDKRFDVVYGDEPFNQVVTDDGVKCTARYCAKILNELHEENQRLKELVYSFRDIDDLNNWRQDYENQMSRENKSSEV